MAAAAPGAAIIRARRGTFGTHAALSLASSLAAAIATVVSLPYIVGGLGFAEYGLFSLIMLSSAYVGALDFGFSWTTTRFLAEAIEVGDAPRTERLLRASLMLYLLIGVTGGLLLAGAAEPIVVWVFNVPDDERQAGATALRIVGAAFPFAMIQVYAGAVMRGARRFDLLTGLQLFGSVGTTIAIVVTIALGGRLVAVVVAVAVCQIAGAVVGLVGARWTLSGAIVVGRVDRTTIASLGRFAAAVGLANVGAQLLYLTNRLAVGMLLPLATVGLFAVPFALAQRLMFVPTALVSAALPSLTTAFVRRDKRDFWKIFWRLAGWMAALMLPAITLAMIWSPTLLRTWFNRDFDANVAWVLRLSLAAVLINAVTAALAVACDSVGTPHVPAVATFIAGIANVPLSFALVALGGIVGAAAAFALSLALLAGLIAEGWRRRRPVTFQLPPLNMTAVARGAILVAAWTGAVIALEPVVDTRVRLVLVGSGMLLAAYAIVALQAGAGIASLRQSRRP